MAYLKNEIRKFIGHVNKPNIYMPNWSIPTMWGGVNLLTMHLKVMRELLAMKSSNIWNWDFVLNLSEADFPIKYDEICLLLKKFFFLF